jgi:sugar lactone lactonase YvrE
VVNARTAMTAQTPFDIIRAENLLGEGIVWDSRRHVLWWTDIHSKMLLRYDWAQGALQALTTPDRVGSFGFIAGSEQLITAFAGGIARYDPHLKSVTWLARPDEVASGVRFNDGRVDHQGRFWTGTMVEGAGEPAAGCLYSFDGSQGLRCHVRNVKISNGLCVSPDGARLYFADSPTRAIWVYDLNQSEGTLQTPRIFARTPPGAFPDGASVDVDGCVWSAHWGAGRIVRYTPAGQVDRTLTVPTCQPSCVCFGGPDLDILCVTSAREDLDAKTLHAEPNAGDVFLYRPGIQGLPESEYRP